MKEENFWKARELFERITELRKLRNIIDINENYIGNISDVLERLSLLNEEYLSSDNINKIKTILYESFDNNINELKKQIDEL